MRVVVPAESIAGERRVAVTPDTVRQLAKTGLEIIVQSGAGNAADIADAALVDAGATVVAAIDAGSVDVLLHVRPLRPKVPSRLPTGAITIGLMSPATELATVEALRAANITSFSMELIPRISRAQSMDALTSQALVAGYRCVLEAAMRLPRFLPLFMTAAGTVPPAKVLVLGAGVAGLQALATAKRLGAKVSGYDVRAASADEVRSMGATFIDLGLDTLTGEGGYAREMTQDRAQQQRDALAPHIADSDIVITTAAVPGKSAPLLVTADMVRAMKPGSVVVDLAAETGGNVEGSVAGEESPVRCASGYGTVTLLGMRDAASTMAADASRLYAKNVANLLALMTSDGEVVPDFEDEVVAGACVTHGGNVVHTLTAELLSATGPHAQPADQQRASEQPADEQPADDAGGPSPTPESHEENS